MAEEQKQDWLDEILDRAERTIPKPVCTPYGYCEVHQVESDDQHDHHDCYREHPLS